MGKITDDDLGMISYFWTEKGDPESWCFWEEKLPDLEREYPEVVQAWISYKIAERILDAVLKGVC